MAPRVRHYRTTTTYRGNGVTNRTVQSRNGWWGPYKSPQEERANTIAIVTLIVFLLAVAWPWLITAIPVWARAIIAVAWYSIVIGVLALGRWKGRQAPSASSTPASAIPARPAPAPPVIPTPATTAPALTPDQVARAHEKATRAIRAQRAAASTPAKSAPPKNVAPIQTTVELTPAEKRDLEARYDAMKAKMEAMRQHLAEYERQKQRDQKD